MSVPVVAVLVPYRDPGTRHRASQLQRWLEEVPATLRAVAGSGCGSPVAFRVLIGVQSQDGRKFSRGRVLNALFRIAEATLPTLCRVVFHDVDLLPDVDRARGMLLDLPPFGAASLHVTGEYAGLADFLGGVCAMEPATFRACDGFPADLEGWGGEDDALRDALFRVAGTRTGVILRHASGTMRNLEVEDGCPRARDHPDTKSPKQTRLAVKEARKTGAAPGLEAQTFAARRVDVTCALEGPTWLDAVRFGEAPPPVATTEVTVFLLGVPPPADVPPALCGVRWKVHPVTGETHLGSAWDATTGHGQVADPPCLGVRRADHAGLHLFPDAPRHVTRQALWVPRVPPGTDVPDAAQVGRAVRAVLTAVQGVARPACTVVCTDGGVHAARLAGAVATMTCIAPTQELAAATWSNLSALAPSGGHTVIVGGYGSDALLLGLHQDAVLLWDDGMQGPAQHAEWLGACRFRGAVVVSTRRPGVWDAALRGSAHPPVAVGGDGVRIVVAWFGAPQ